MMARMWGAPADGSVATTNHFLRRASAFTWERGRPRPPRRNSGMDGLLANGCGRGRPRSQVGRISARSNYSTSLRDLRPDQVFERLPATDEAGGAVADEDDRRAQGAIVVARHRRGVGAAGRHGEDIAGLQVGQVDVADEDVPGLAELAGDRHRLRRLLLRAVGDDRLV